MWISGAGIRSDDLKKVDFVIAKYCVDLMWKIAEMLRVVTTAEMRVKIAMRKPAGDELMDATINQLVQLDKWAKQLSVEEIAAAVLDSLAS